LFLLTKGSRRKILAGGNKRREAEARFSKVSEKLNFELPKLLFFLEKQKMLLACLKTQRVKSLRSVHGVERPQAWTDRTSAEHRRRVWKCLYYPRRNHIGGLDQKQRRDKGRVHKQRSSKIEG